MYGRYARGTAAVLADGRTCAPTGRRQSYRPAACRRASGSAEGVVCLEGPGKHPSKTRALLCAAPRMPIRVVSARHRAERAPQLFRCKAAGHGRSQRRKQVDGVVLHARQPTRRRPPGPCRLRRPARAGTRARRVHARVVVPARGAKGAPSARSGTRRRQRNRRARTSQHTPGLEREREKSVRGRGSRDCRKPMPRWAPMIGKQGAQQRVECGAMHGDPIGTARDLLHRPVPPAPGNRRSSATATVL